eukprot:5047253-Pyramimonas_sp.AAC.3
MLRVGANHRRGGGICPEWGPITGGEEVYAQGGGPVTLLGPTLGCTYTSRFQPSKTRTLDTIEERMRTCARRPML